MIVKLGGASLLVRQHKVLVKIVCLQRMLVLIRCTAITDSGSFTSGPFTLRISGIYVVVYFDVHINGNIY